MGVGVDSFNDVFHVADDDVPAGRDYKLRITGARGHESQAGRSNIIVTLDVIGSADASALSKTFDVFFQLEGRSARYLVPLLNACGVERENGKYDFGPNDLVGKVIVADVTIQETESARWVRLANIRAAS